MLFKIVFGIKRHQIYVFFSVFQWFWCVEVKNEKNLKKFIVIYFQAKTYFEKHPALQSQTHT
jgi:hypothetical protein